MSKKEQWQKELATSRTALNELLDSLTPEQWLAPVFGEGDGWSIADVVAHLVETERGMSIHIYKIRREKETVPAGFDLTQWNAGLKERAGRVSPEELRKQLPQVRNRTLKEMDTLQDSEWQLTGRHPARGTITVEQYYETIAGHEKTHTQDIKAALKTQ